MFEKLKDIKEDFKNEAKKFGNRFKEELKRSFQELNETAVGTVEEQMIRQMESGEVGYTHESYIAAKLTKLAPKNLKRRYYEVKKLVAKGCNAKYLYRYQHELERRGLVYIR